VKFFKKMSKANPLSLGYLEVRDLRVIFAWFRSMPEDTRRLIGAFEDEHRGMCKVENAPDGPAVIARIGPPPIGGAA
jgi:hypothetical protein